MQNLVSLWISIGLLLSLRITYYCILFSFFFLITCLC